jgi:hypothetical protein
VSQRAEVLTIEGLRWSAGAPQPIVFRSERRTLLAFFAADDERGDDEVVSAEFENCAAITCGFPNDEVLHGHALWGRGLEFYRLHEVKESDWLDELRAVEAVHDQAPTMPFSQARHFVLTFHDSTVEAVADDLVVRDRYPSMEAAAAALAEMVSRT